MTINNSLTAAQQQLTAAKTRYRAAVAEWRRASAVTTELHESEAALAAAAQAFDRELARTTEAREEQRSQPRNFTATPAMCSVLFHLYDEVTNRPYACTLTHGGWGDTEIDVRNVGSFRLVDGGTAWHGRPEELAPQIERFIGQYSGPWPVNVNLVTHKEWDERGDGWLEWANTDRSVLVQVRGDEASLFDGDLTGEGYLCMATIKGVREGTPVNVVLASLRKQLIEDYRRKLR